MTPPSYPNGGGDRPDSHRDLLLEREVDVPPERIWAAWTTPDHLMQWFAPAPFTTVDCQVDLRPGGVFRTVMRSPEGEDLPSVGCYLEVVDRRRLVWTTPKYVASTTLQEVSWPNASLLGGDVAEEVSRLKAEPGGDIGVHGSPELVRYLLQHDLVDELRLAVFPVAVGKGGRLFDGLDQMRHLELVHVDRTGQGVLVLTYQPVAA